MSKNAFARLKEGVESWNKWRDEYPHNIPYLRHAQLSDFNLAGANLRVAYLQDANFQRANLSGADLRAARLGGSDFTEAILKGAKYSKRTIWPDGFDPQAAGAILVAEYSSAEDNQKGTESHAKKLHLHGVKLWNEWRDKNPNTQPNLRLAELSGQVLIDVNLSGADLSGANLSVCEMTNANLDGANLSDTNLSFAGLSGAILSNANLHGANLQGIDLTKAKHNKNTIWPEGFELQTSGIILID